MRALVQRVSRARVTVGGEETGSIGRGLLILLGVHGTDDETKASWMAKKCSMLRVFADDQGKMNLSLLEVGGDALVVSQFTLYGDASKGNRPSYIDAAQPSLAEPLVDRFVQLLSAELGKKVETGRFGADMDVELSNQGPVTIFIER